MPSPSPVPSRRNCCHRSDRRRGPILRRIFRLRRGFLARRSEPIFSRNTPASRRLLAGGPRRRHGHRSLRDSLRRPRQACEGRSNCRHSSRRRGLRHYCLPVVSSAEPTPFSALGRRDRFCTRSPRLCRLGRGTAAPAAVHVPRFFPEIIKKEKKQREARVRIARRESSSMQHV